MFLGMMTYIFVLISWCFDNSVDVMRWIEWLGLEGAPGMVQFCWVVQDRTNSTAVQFTKVKCIPLLFFFLSFVGNCEIDLEIKRYFCRAGVKSIQVKYNSSLF